MLCVGSVFKSWRLLRAGFLRRSNQRNEDFGENHKRTQIDLLQCVDNDSSLGAARLAARLIQQPQSALINTPTSTFHLDSILFWLDSFMYNFSYINIYFVQFFKSSDASNQWWVINFFFVSCSSCCRRYITCCYSLLVVDIFSCRSFVVVVVATILLQ